ncbi:hypothetical protein [Polaribacter sargassicola]|uniref:hypothetical protein n=1 Tax=Polaribacter sargassicola TaxID=2836891 RepID=UPI001F41B3AE|nr:hypothetical protein [Polaribacter sp. DS7-9]MCG1036503.1 hypothetical protein [Polaribacter sp. DS7-9]
MANIKAKSSLLVFFIIWFIYIAFFSFVTMLIRMDGYINFEPLFITSHINTLFDSGELVKNFFLSYPLLTNSLAYPFSIFSAEDAPFFASVFYTSLFATFVVTVVGKEKSNTLKGFVFLYFLVSPITIYTATSGTSVYAFYILYFFIFYYLFNYIKNFTTYHIAILSIILSLATFLDYRILWLLPILFFYVFIFSLYGMKGLKSSNIIIKYIKTTQHHSLRRKFRGRLGSMIFIIGFFPVTSLLLYFIINYLMGNDFFYFYDSLDTKWNGNSIFSLLEINTITSLDNRAVNNFSFFNIVLFISPIFIFEIIRHYKKPLNIIILSLVPLLLYTLLRDSNTNFMNLSYYVIIIAAAIASIAAATSNNLKFKKVSYLIYACLFSINIYGEYQYLKKSSFTSEQIYFNSVINKEQNTTLLEYKEGGRYLAANTPENAIVLCDRSIMYPLVAYNKDNNFFISNSSTEFKNAIYNPTENCDYIILSNAESPFYYYDKVEANFNNIEKNGLSVNDYRTKVIYFSNTFRILKVIK